MKKAFYILIFLSVQLVGNCQNSSNKVWIGLNIIDSLINTGVTNLEATKYIEYSWNPSFISLSKGKAEYLLFKHEKEEKFNLQYAVKGNDYIFQDKNEIVFTGKLSSDSTLTLKLQGTSAYRVLTFIPFKTNLQDIDLSKNQIKEKLIDTKWENKANGQKETHEFLANGIYRHSMWSIDLKWKIIEFKGQPIILLDYGTLYRPNLYIIRKMTKDELIIESQAKNEFITIQLTKIK